MKEPPKDETLALIGALIGGVLAFAVLGYLVGLMG